MNQALNAPRSAAGEAASQAGALQWITCDRASAEVAASFLGPATKPVNSDLDSAVSNKRQRTEPEEPTLLIDNAPQRIPQITADAQILVSRLADAPNMAPIAHLVDFPNMAEILDLAPPCRPVDTSDIVEVPLEPRREEENHKRRNESDMLSPRTFTLTSGGEGPLTEKCINDLHHIPAPFVPEPLNFVNQLLPAGILIDSYGMFKTYKSRYFGDSSQRSFIFHNIDEFSVAQEALRLTQELILSSDCPNQIDDLFKQNKDKFMSTLPNGQRERLCPNIKKYKELFRVFFAYQRPPHTKFKDPRYVIVADYATFVDAKLALQQFKRAYQFA